VHNTYLTLPVLVFMVSGHYPILIGHPQAWILAGLIIVGGAAVRHLLVRHEAGDPLNKIGWTLPVIAIALFAALWLTAPAQRPASPPEVASDAEVLAIVQQHCASCHAANPATRPSPSRRGTWRSRPSRMCAAMAISSTSLPSRPTSCRLATRPG
jgi:uncharacterized membrane protein